MAKLHLGKNLFLLSLAISLAVMLANYVVCNTSIPLPDEMKVLQYCDQFRRWNGWAKDSIPDEVMLVDVAYDKQLVDYGEDGFHLGEFAITNRQRLYDFLTIAKRTDNYRYIMLDVVFEKGIASPQDSALFQLIASMDRIVIPVHQDKPLQDSILYAKAANADYTVTWEETNFSRFQYIHDGVKSMPLRMYEDLQGQSITRWGFLFFSEGWICRNGITLKMPIRMYDDLTDLDEDGILKVNTLKLGSELLAADTVAPVRDEIEDKIIVIGNFMDDVHDTYAGRQSGSLICLNAYYALVRGDHIIWGKGGGTFLFYLLTACIYFILSMVYLNGLSLSKLSKNPWLKLLLSLVSINAFFWTIAFVIYLLSDLVYNVWIPITVFTVLDFVVNNYFSYRNKKNEKKNPFVFALPAGTDSHESGQLQNPLPQLPQNTD